MSNLLIKTTDKGYEKVYPKTYSELVIDKGSGKNLTDILNSYNMYFLSYTGNVTDTRCLVPKDLRREGLWITYVNFNHKVITEWYNSNDIDDETWGIDTYWRQGSNKLIGDISISSNGNWVIDGNETEFKATGDPIKPLLRVNFSTNKLQVSYDDGNKYEDLGNNSVYTTFRTANNKLLVSTDLGKTWTDTSEPIAAWFKWSSGDTADSVGKILISRDNSTWEDLSPNIVNNLRIKGYVATVGNLPSSAALGDIYMVGPTYDTSDTTHDYPHYRMWVKQSSGWVDNGEYLSNVLISLTTGLETGITMSLKAITDKLIAINLLNITTNNIIQGGYIDGRNGNVIKNSEYSYSEYIKVINNYDFLVNILHTLSSTNYAGYAWYNSDKSFLLGAYFNKQTIEGNIKEKLTAPKEASYLRVSFFSNEETYGEIGIYILDYRILSLSEQIETTKQECNSLLAELVDNLSVKTDQNNLLEYWYKREKYVKAIREVQKRGEISAESRIADRTFPAKFYGNRYMTFSSPIENNTGANLNIVLFRCYLRRLKNIHFSAWIFWAKTSIKQVFTLNFNVYKQYPYNSTHGKWTLDFDNFTDYSSAKENPIIITVNNTVLGDLTVIIDDFIKDENGYFFHLNFEKNIDIEYSHFSLTFKAATVIDGYSYNSKLMLINPIVNTTDGDFTIEETTDKNYLLTPFCINNGLTIMGSSGHVAEKSNQYRYMEIKVDKTDIKYNCINNNSHVDLHLHSDDNLITPTANINNSITVVSTDWLPQEVYETGVMYFQYKLKFEDIFELSSVYSNPSNNGFRVSEELITVQGFLINDKSVDDYNPDFMIVDFSETGYITVRNTYRISQTRSLNVGFAFKQNDYTKNDITIYDMVLSAQPPMLNALRKTNADFTTQGKTFMIFGDSEFNWGSQYKIPVERLGMRVYVGAMGAHMMAYNPTYNTGEGVGDGHGWLYAWEYRKEVFTTPVDYYIFCVSTNDNNSGIALSESTSGKYDYQSIEDEDIQYVLDNYPSFGDTDEDVALKMAKFKEFEKKLLEQKFNLSSVYCAYIEQILQFNPKARIILANSPITCTGLLQGTTDETGKGVWKEGQSPKTARKAKKPIFDRLSIIMQNIADKYNLPLLDFYHNVGLTFENFTQYCIDGTHWTDIVNNDKYKGVNYIAEREGELITKYLLQHKN